MDCIKIDSLAEKYEFGELDYFNTKRFESHVKKCSRCQKKYGTLLLLGAVLYASSKTFTPSPFKLFMSSLFFKILFITISTFTVLYFSYFAAKQSEINNIEKLNTINKSSYNNSYLNQKINNLILNNKSNSNSSNLRHINIISKDKQKEIQLKVNIRKIDIESRTEK